MGLNLLVSLGCILVVLTRGNVASKLLLELLQVLEEELEVA